MPRRVTLQIVIGPGDTGEPEITITQPGERELSYDPKMSLTSATALSCWSFRRASIALRARGGNLRP